MSNFPMWHRRFTTARNHLAESITEMEQAYFEDHDNPKFKAFHDRLSKILTSVDNQWMRNLKRGRKEGWMD